MPTNGEITMNCAILIRPGTSTDCGPAPTTAAPTKPPIKAWEDDVGRPSHQVIRFHTIAPATPASRMCGVTAFESITPLPIVFATCVPSTANATKLKNAAHTTASLGESTRVETTVAIELAASWKPLM